MLSEVAEIARVAQRVLLILNFNGPHAITYTNNTHEKFLHSDWLTAVELFFFKQCRTEILNSLQKEVTTQAF